MSNPGFYVFDFNKCKPGRIQYLISAFQLRMSATGSEQLVLSKNINFSHLRHKTLI